MTVFRLLRRYLLCALTLACVGGTYLLSKPLPDVTPAQLPLTALDGAIPFLPASVWLYSSLTLLIFIVFVALPRWLDVRRFAGAIVLATGIAACCFTLFPTAYPRADFVLPPDTPLVHRAAMESLWEVDTPANCLPSLHVALASLCALALAGACSGRARWAGVAWALAICATTLTTKQHYLLDVPAGMLLGGGAWLALCRGLCEDSVALGARRFPGLRTPPARRLLEAVEGHQWALEEVAWPERVEPLPKPMVGFLNQVIAIEELAGQCFAFLERASADPGLRRLYAAFAAEERRHAEVFRELLRRAGAPRTGPGLGAALQLEMFSSLRPDSDVDVMLVSLAIPVFETFLDGGIVPFLREQGCGGPALEAALARIDGDERAHLAHNWRLARRLLGAASPRTELRAALNPHLLFGVTTVPMVAFETFVRALRLGFDFSRLWPSFDRLGRMRTRHAELAGSALWTWFEIFCVCGRAASQVCWWAQREGLLTGRWLVKLAGLQRRLAWLLFGSPQLRTRGLPVPGPVA